jgi:alpha-amylase
MTDVSLCFEVHQPLRLKREFFWCGLPLRRMTSDLRDFYFDDQENRRIFERVSSKCYLPANDIILESIKKFEDSDKPFKVAYSFSGVFLDQCRMYKPDVLDSFVRLIDSGYVEVMEQTYYHSLSSLFEDKREFYEQVRMHRELVWDIFGLKPTTFENTELIFNEEIARIVEGMGYRAIFTEGIVADPNFVYRPKGTGISLLLRNYQLTDDIGFRFSSRWWEEYPLTADKYAAWLSAAHGKCINIFCDYETFGEHQWEETGIFNFLRYLPAEVLKRNNLRYATPSEIARDNTPVGELSIDRTVSWADLERDTSCWLGNALQQACFIYLNRLEAPVKESMDSELIETWRLLGISDHLYYMFTHGGGPGEVHNYFSPYGNPYDAAVTYFSALSDMHYRLKGRVRLADEPFILASGDISAEAVWSLEGLNSALAKIDITSLEYHMSRGDFSEWSRTSLGETGLADEIDRLKTLKGERLRKALLKTISRCLNKD